MRVHFFFTSVYLAALAILISCCSVQALHAQVIGKLEYFVDTDPGFGAGTPVAVSPEADISNLIVPINIGSLSDGLHTIGIRSFRAGNGWSLTNQSFFMMVTPSQHLLQRVEYFLDTDPGFGLATAVSFTPSANVPPLQIPVNLASISIGFHVVHVRSMAADGRWSLTNQVGFLKLPTTVGLSQAEYFFDVDPGFGRATPLAFNTAMDLAGFVAQVNITGLSTGLHHLFVRSKEGGDDWSLTNVMPVSISSSVQPPFINVNSLTDYNPCAGTAFRMAYHATGSHTPGNRFDVQLSNASGSFTNPITLGGVQDTADRIVTIHLPKNLPDGSNYRIRVVSSQEAVTGIPNAQSIVVRAAPQLGPDTTSIVVCQQDSANITGIFPSDGYQLFWSITNPAKAPIGVHQLITINALGCRDTALVTIRQDILRWVGGINSDWHTPGNWQTGTIPTSKSHVIIPAQVSHTCTLQAANASIASMQLAAGAVFMAISGRQLTIEAGCMPLPPL